MAMGLQWVNCMVCKLHLSKPVTRISFEEDPMSPSLGVQKDTIHSPNNAKVRVMKK